MLAFEITIIEVKSIKVFAKIDLFAFLVFIVCLIKRKTTRKIVN